MSEHVMDSQHNPEPAHTPGGDSSNARKPFVPPSVQELGRMTQLTLIGGSL